MIKRQIAKHRLVGSLTQIPTLIQREKDQLEQQ